MRSLFLVIFCSIAHLSIAQSGSTKGWTAVYANDENGKSISGNINDLLDGMRKGYSLKVGWSWTRTLGDSTVTLEHFAEPIFSTIIQKKHVSIVINAHPMLKSYLDISKQQFDNPDAIWQCVLTTQGTFNAMVYSGTKGEVVRNWPQRHKMTWYVEYP